MKSIAFTTAALMAAYDAAVIDFLKVSLVFIFLRFKISYKIYVGNNIVCTNK
jgi:hypothetical protein